MSSQSTLDQCGIQKRRWTRWCIVRAPAVLAVLLLALGGRRFSVTYISKQAARLSFALALGDDSFERTDETMAYNRALDRFEFSRYRTGPIPDGLPNSQNTAVGRYCVASVYVSVSDKISSAENLRSMPSY